MGICRGIWAAGHLKPPILMGWQTLYAVWIKAKPGKHTGEVIPAKQEILVEPGKIRG